MEDVKRFVCACGQEDCPRWEKVKAYFEEELSRLREANSVLMDELEKHVNMKKSYGYRSPEQQSLEVTALIVSYGKLALEAIEKAKKIMEGKE